MTQKQIKLINIKADLWGAKIKITQKEDLIKSLGIVVKDEK